MQNIIYISLKALEAFLKILLSFAAPLLIGLTLSGELYLVLSVVFILAPFMVGGSELSILRIFTSENISSVSKVNVVKSFLKLSILILLFLLVTFTFLNYFSLLSKINPAIGSFWIEIIISAFFFSIITILAWGLRAEGQLIANQLIIGIFWPLMCFFYIFKVGYLNISGQSFPFFFMMSLLVLLPIVSFKLLKKININFQSNLKGEKLKIFKYNITFFIQTLSSVSIQWLPILFVGLKFQGDELGFFSIVYRLSLGLLAAIVISNMLGSKSFSELHQSKSFRKLKLLFRRLTLLSTVLGIIGFIVCIFIIIYLADNQDLGTNLYGPYFLLFIITCTTFFGPCGMFLNMVDKEIQLRKINICTMLSIIFVGILGNLYFSVGSLYFLFGIIIFLQSYAAYIFKNNYFREVL